ncbi:MAG: GNAT family N-acetyltransferase [Syntrophales bacterium]
MADYTIRSLDRHNEKDRCAWARFMSHAPGATIFHLPDFLSYHQDRFHEHHLAIYKGEELFGIMPLAIIGQDGVKTARSPYGASYGGMIFSSLPTYDASKRIAKELICYLNAAGVKQLIITPPPGIYYPSYSDTFIFSLLEHGFRHVNSNITSVVKLVDNIERDLYNMRARRAIAKARKAELHIIEQADLDIFWGLMEKTFARHGTKPTHTLMEFKYLQAVLPAHVRVDIAYKDATPVAGIAYFKINDLVNMSFYICSDPEYRDLQGVSLIVHHGILNSLQAGFRYFDLGTSSINMVGNEHIFEFKENFGACGCFRHTYLWEADS